MKKLLMVMVAIVFVSIISAAVYFTFSKHDQRGIESTVSRIIDGDTIELANGDKVRLVGIDAPEKNQPYYKEVISQLKILEGKSVRMEKDKTNKDRYGRYLRYIFLGDNFINLELVQNGLAYVYIVNPDKKYEKEFLDAEAVARANGVGVWKKSKYTGCIEVKIHYNAKGEDDKNLVDEFFTLKNLCNEEILATNWTVRNTFNLFRIPNFNLEDGSVIKIISGEGKNSKLEIFLSSARPIWNNKGDSLYIRDNYGAIIASESYSNA